MTESDDYFGEDVSSMRYNEIRRLQSVNASLCVTLETVRRWLELNNRQESIIYRPVCDAIAKGKS